MRIRLVVVLAAAALLTLSACSTNAGTAAATAPAEGDLPVVATTVSPRIRSEEVPNWMVGSSLTAGILIKAKSVDGS